jgi:hypothetical protein
MHARERTRRWVACALALGTALAAGCQEESGAAPADAADGGATPDAADVAADGAPEADDAAGTADAAPVDLRDAAPVADSDGAPVAAPVVPCPGEFVMTAWTFDTAPFPPRILNELVAGDLAAGELVVALRFEEGPDLVWVDAVVDANGDLAPDPEVAPSAPMRLDLAPDGAFSNPIAGEVVAHLRTADYPGAQPIDWHLYGVRIEGAFDGDCGTVRGRLAGAFRNEDGFTIPAAPDVDTDGDGVADAFQLASAFVAVRN